jgi:hypothetical protein
MDIGIVQLYRRMYYESLKKNEDVFMFLFRDF